MKNYTQIAEKLIDQYNAKKATYKYRVIKYREKGWARWYKHGQEYIDDIEATIARITPYLASKDVSCDVEKLSGLVRHLKDILKKLHDIAKPTWRQWIEAIIVAGCLAFFIRTYLFGLYHVPTGSAEPTILVGDRIWGNKLSYLFSNVSRGDSVIFDKQTFQYSSNPFKRFWQRYIGVPLSFFGLHSMPENWVKRVIALPGDIIEGRIENGKTVVYVNNEKLDEPYVNKYPLIQVRKSIGFLQHGTLGPLPLPSFLQKRDHTRNYTYDASVAFDEQPYYAIKQHELVCHPLTGEYILSHPYTPTYSAFGASRDSFGPYKVPKGKYWVMGDSRKNSEDSRYWLFLDEERIHGKASFVIYSIDSEEPLWLFELIKHPIRFWFTSLRWNRIGKGIY